MPRRLTLASGDGIVCLEGAGMTDLQLSDIGVQLDARRGVSGCLFNDEQFDSLAALLNVSTSMHSRALRAELDELREFLVKCTLRNVGRSAQRERNAALSAFIKSLSKFDVTVANITNYPTSSDNGSCDDRSLFSIFNDLPFRLNVFALRLEAQIEEDTRPLALVRRQRDRLAAAAAASLDVAKRLQCLCSDSQIVVLRSLCWTNDYHADSIQNLIDVCRRLKIACEQAHAIGLRPGPRRSGEFDQLILWLARLYKSCGNEVTHTPYRTGGIYDGAPQSPLGKFIVRFFECCDTGVRPQAISTALARTIKSRNLI